ncbi:MAG: hypothetical protein ACI9YT_002080 [Halobacteriales archaeon]
MLLGPGKNVLPNHQFGSTDRGRPGRFGDRRAQPPAGFFAPRQRDDEPAMSDARDRTAPSSAGQESHVADVAGVVGCVEIWERLSEVREADREAEAE